MNKKVSLIVAVFLLIFLQANIVKADDLLHNNSKLALYENWIRAFAQDPGLKKFYGIPWLKAGGKKYYWDTVEKENYHALGMIYYKATQNTEDATIYYNYIIDMLDNSIDAFNIGKDLSRKNFSSIFKKGLKEALNLSSKDFVSHIPVNPLYKDELTRQLSDITNTLVLDVAGGLTLSEKRAALYQLLIKKAAEASINWAGWFAELRAFQQYTSSLLAESFLDEFYNCGADFVVLREKFKGENGLTSLPPKPYNYTENDWIIYSYVKNYAIKNNFSFKQLIDEDYERIHKTINFINSYTEDYFNYYENHPNDFKPRRSSLRPIISLLLNSDSSGLISANNIAVGNVRFEDQDGSKLPLPDNAWIRIVPKTNQIEGNYDGINCKIIPSSYSSNYSGKFGQLFCYARSQETLNSFNDHSEKFQIVIYEQTQNQGEDGWAQWNKEEFAYCGYTSTENPDMNMQPYGAWSSHTCVYNGPGVTESVGNDRDALLIPNGGETWTYGETRTIQWMTQYITGPTVDLYVLHDDPNGLLDKDDPNIGYIINRKQWYRFAASVSNTGSYSLDPQELSGIGNAYMILVVSVSDKSKFDLSDATFTLSN